MQSRTVFNSRLITPICRWLSHLYLRLTGWKIKGHRAALTKCVYVAAPHTSNWDFPLMLAVCFVEDLHSRWVGKHTLFPFAIGGLMKWLGGIPIDRRDPRGFIDQIADRYQTMDRLELVITPEGTRSKVREWKTGYYRIAMAANVPIILASVNYPEKTVEFCPEPFYPTGDYDTDFAQIQKFYTGKIGIRSDGT